MSLENQNEQQASPVYPEKTGISVDVSDNPVSIDRVVTERRPYTVKSYDILKIEENTEQQTVRVRIRLEDGAVLWLTALEGQDYRDNVDYSQADLEAAIKQNLLTGKFEG